MRWRLAICLFGALELASIAAPAQFAITVIPAALALQHGAAENMLTAAADPSNSLIGEWRVARAEHNRNPAPANGVIIFAKDGEGYQDFTVQTAEGPVQFQGRFAWESTPMFITVDQGGEPANWMRLRDDADRQDAKIRLAGRADITVVLYRDK